MATSPASEAGKCRACWTGPASGCTAVRLMMITPTANANNAVNGPVNVGAASSVRFYRTTAGEGFHDRKRLRGRGRSMLDFLYVMRQLNIAHSYNAFS